MTKNPKKGLSFDQNNYRITIDKEFERIKIFQFIPPNFLIFEIF